MHAVASPTFVKRCTTLRGIKDDSSGADRRGLTAQRQLIGALDDEEHFFLAEMDVIGWAFAGFVPRHDDRNGAAGCFGGEEDPYLKAERLDRQCVFGRDDGGL
jgi:hypothetical protein